MSSPAINEGAIAKVEAEIKKVNDKIDGVELKIEAETDKDEKAALREKEKQLRVTLNKWIDRLNQLGSSSASDSGKFPPACSCSYSCSCSRPCWYCCSLCRCLFRSRRDDEAR
jgi:hypothetical protein